MQGARTNNRCDMMIAKWCYSFYFVSSCLISLNTESCRLLLNVLSFDYNFSQGSYPINRQDNCCRRKLITKMEGAHGLHELLGFLSSLLLFVRNNMHSLSFEFLGRLFLPLEFFKLKEIQIFLIRYCPLSSLGLQFGLISTSKGKFCSLFPSPCPRPYNRMQ